MCWAPSTPPVLPVDGVVAGTAGTAGAAGDVPAAVLPDDPPTCTVPAEPDEPFPPPIWTVPAEPLASFPPVPPTVTGSESESARIGPARFTVGVAVTGPDCTVPAEPDDVFPPPTCTVPAVLSSPLPTVAGALTDADSSEVDADADVPLETPPDCTVPIEWSAELLPPATDAAVFPPALPPAGVDCDVPADRSGAPPSWADPIDVPEVLPPPTWTEPAEPVAELPPPLPGTPAVTSANAGAASASAPTAPAMATSIRAMPSSPLFVAPLRGADP